METYNPYAIGRWYRIFIESDGTDRKITQTDIDASEIEISGDYLKMPFAFHVIDVKYDIMSSNGGAASALGGLKIYNDGCQAIAIPKADVYDSAYIYVFGY